MQLAFFLIDPCSELRSLSAVILKGTQKADPLPHNRVEEELSPRSALLRSEKQWWLQKNRWENWQGINLGWNVKISSCRAAAHLSSLVWGLWWGYGTLILQQTSLSGMLNADHLRQWFRGKIYALRSPCDQSLALSCVRAGDGIQLPRMSLPTICSYVVWLHRKSFFSPRFTLPRGHLDLSAYVCQSFWRKTGRHVVPLCLLDPLLKVISNKHKKLALSTGHLGFTLSIIWESLWKIALTSSMGNLHL